MCSALFACNNSTQKSSETSSNVDSLAASDTVSGNGQQDDSSQFIKESLEGSAMEVELGKLAQKQAFSLRVKAFGAMMVKDHTAAGDELKQIASKKNIALTADMEGDHMKDMDEFRNKTGVDFDKKYIKVMLSHHRKTIEMFEDQAEDNKDPELRAFSEKSLPKLKMHLDSAKSINKEVKASLDKNDISDAMERYPNH